jgi:hypothetical protein
MENIVLEILGIVRRYRYNLLKTISTGKIERRKEPNRRKHS